MKRYGPGTSLAHDQGQCFPNCGYCSDESEARVKTNREVHEEAAGQGLCPEFFTINNIDPNGIAEDDYVAWLRYVRHPNGATTIRTCDQSEDGAFKVYRKPELRKPPYARIDKIVTDLCGWPWDHKAQGAYAAICDIFDKGDREYGEGGTDPSSDVRRNIDGHLKPPNNYR